MPRVLVAGASGYLGSIITEQLVSAGINTTALVRSSNSTVKPERETRLSQLKAAGLEVTEGSLEDVSVIADLLKNFDTVVSVLSGPSMAQAELNLVEAARQAGTIKLFIPSQFGGEYPVKGPYKHLYTPPLKAIVSGKDAVLEALKAAGLPYTKFVSYALFGFSLPHFGSVAFPGSPASNEAKIYGDGTKKGAFTAEADVGRVVAKAVNDPRVVNKTLVVRVNPLTQKELVSAYSAATGNQVSLTSVSAEEVDAAIKGAPPMLAFIHGLHKALWIDGLYELDEGELGCEDAVYATELYPNIHFETAEEFYARGSV